MSVVITAGQRGDSPQFEAVLEAIRVPRLGLGRPRKRPDRVRADKAYELPRQSLLPAQTRDQSHHSGSGGPSPQPPQAWTAWRAPTEVRQGRLQATARGRVRDQPAQAPPGRRHSVRQTRRPLRSDSAGRSHQRVAVTSTFTTGPSRPRSSASTARTGSPTSAKGRSPRIRSMRNEMVMAVIFSAARSCVKPRTSRSRTEELDREMRGGLDHRQPR